MGTFVYRAYDAAGDLLYVGISTNVAKRLDQHRRTSAWHADMVSHEVQGPMSHEGALAVEDRAIRKEGPAYNRRNNGARRAELERQEAFYSSLTDRERDLIERHYLDLVFGDPKWRAVA